MRPLAILLALLLAALGQPALAAGARVVVPVSVTTQANGVVRYSVMVSVGGGPAFPAMLDTGSVGLRLLPGAVAPDRYRSTGQPLRASFGSGVELEGVLALADVAVGDFQAGRAKIQAAQTARCLAGREQCPAASAAPGQYRIGGDGVPGQGFAAVLGIGLRPNPAQNPLSLDGGGAWILVLPRPGDSQPGVLIINPDDADRAGFTLFQLQPREAPAGKGWMDTELPVCIAWADAAAVCEPTLLDSGTPNMTLTDPTVSAGWRPGMAGVLTFGEPGKGLTQHFHFGEGPGARLRLLEAAPGRQRQGLNTGFLPYLAFAVLYDARAGVIGLKPRDGSSSR